MRASGWIAGGVLVLAYLGTTLDAQAAHESTVWLERQITVVAPGLSPNAAAWDSWLSLTPNLSSIAYAVRFRSVDGWRESVVIGDEREPEYNYASRPVISPDGRHVAYIAVVESGSSQPAFLIVDKARIQIQHEDNRLGPEWIPVFSPDSSEIAFVAERSAGRYAVGVAQVARAPERVLPVEWGPEFVAIDRPRWSRNSLDLAYSAARSRTAWVAMMNTEVVGAFPDVSFVEFAPDGRLAFRGSDGRKQFIVLAGECQQAYDETTAPTFRADGTLVYTASEGKKHFVVVGDRRTELPHAAEGAVVSTDGQRITHWYREKRGMKPRLVINGVPGPEFMRISRPSIHPETGAFAYTAQDEQGFFVITSRGRSPRYDGVLWDPHINADGTSTAYAALTDRTLWWKVVPLK